MGRRRSEKTTKCKVTFSVAIQEILEELEHNRHPNGDPIKIEIILNGKIDEKMCFEINNLDETLDILRINSNE